MKPSEENKIIQTTYLKYEPQPIGYIINLDDHKSDGWNTKSSYFEFERNGEKIKVSNKEMFDFFKKTFFKVQNETD